MKDLSIEELEQLKKEWYEKAMKANLLLDISNIARYLGVKLSNGYGPKYKYETGDIVIYVDDYGNYSTVKYKNKQVMSTHPTNKLFIPGIWVDLLDIEIEHAKKQREKKNSLEAEKRRKELLEKLTL